MPTATRVLSPTLVMRRAWASARAGARRFGGKPSLYIVAALRDAWAATKAALAEVAAMRARVSAEVEKIRAEGRARFAAEQARREAARKVAVLPPRRPAGPVVTGDEDGFLARLAAGQARMAAAPIIARAA
jgi:Streptococcus thermophilus bacteriophage Gp111 protein